MIENFKNIEEQKNWRLIAVAPATERTVARLLAERRITAYVPVERVYVGAGYRRREHERPLVRSYVFVQMASHEQLIVEAVPGVRAFIGAGQQSRAFAAHVDQINKFMADLLIAEDAGDYDHTRRRTQFAVGDHVWVSSGKFKGLAGVIGRMTQKRRAELVLSIFGRAGRMTVSLDHIEHAA